MTTDKGECYGGELKCNHDDIGGNEYNEDDYGGEQQHHFVLFVWKFSCVLLRGPSLSKRQRKRLKNIYSACLFPVQLVPLTWWSEW